MSPLGELAPRGAPSPVGSRERRLFRAILCLAAAGAGAGVATSGCAASSEVKYTGAAHPAVPLENVEVLGDQTPHGFTVSGVVTATCETLNGASGVLEGSCTEDELLALARKEVANHGGHALVDVRCRKELLERSFENRDGGGVNITTRERLSCQATVARYASGGAPRPRGAVDAGTAAAPSRGKRVMVQDVPVTVEFVAAAGRRGGVARAEEQVGELDEVPRGYAVLGTLAAICTSTCAPRHGRAALRQEAARLGGLAVAGVRCEVAGADRWRCDATLVGDLEVPSGAANADGAKGAADGGGEEEEADAGPEGPSHEAPPLESADAGDGRDTPSGADGGA